MTGEADSLTPIPILDRLRKLAECIGADVAAPLRDGSLAFSFSRSPKRRKLIWHPDLRPDTYSHPGLLGTFSTVAIPATEVPALVENLADAIRHDKGFPANLSRPCGTDISLDRWFVVAHLAHFLEGNRSMWGPFLFTEVHVLGPRSVRLIFESAGGRLSFQVCPRSDADKPDAAWFIAAPLAFRVVEECRPPALRRRIIGQVENYLMYAFTRSFSPDQTIRLPESDTDTSHGVVSQALPRPVAKVAERSTDGHDPNRLAPAQFPLSVFTMEDLDQRLAHVPLTIRRDKIRDAFCAIRNRFPGPRNEAEYQTTWCLSEQTEKGDDVRKSLIENFPAPDAEGPMSIYLHLPFCQRRCAFCGCYSLPSSELTAAKIPLYLAALSHEMREWASLGRLSQRPVTTVHLGGGTPLFIGQERLGKLVNEIRTLFHTTPETEFAIETTFDLLKPGELDFLAKTGIRRIHVGLQTLDREVRRRVGRPTAPDIALLRLSEAVRRGFVVTVDVLCGLPGETLSGYIDTIQKLCEIGLSGVTTIPLKFTESNQKRLLAASGSLSRDYLNEFIMLHCAEQLLQEAGYEKRHYTHHARPEDRNLYILHHTRGEDLLAMGPNAFGEFARYHYQNALLDDYLLHDKEPARRFVFGCQGRPLLEGPGRVAAALTVGQVNRELALRELGSERVQEWLNQNLIALSTDGNSLNLTASGSWFFTEIRRTIEAIARGCCPPTG